MNGEGELELALMLEREPVYVIAAFARIAFEWAKRRGVPRGRLRYLGRPEQVLGLSDVTVFDAGGPGHAGFYRVYEELRARGIKVIYDHVDGIR